MTLFNNGQQNVGGVQCWRVDDLDKVTANQQSGNYNYTLWTTQPVALIPVATATLAQMPAVCAAIQQALGG